MRKVSSAPNLKGISPVGTPSAFASAPDERTPSAFALAPDKRTSIIKSSSNTSLSAFQANIDIELATHAPISSLSKCIVTYGFPDEIVKKDDMKDFIACVMTPEEEEKRELSCPVQDERFERVASVVRRQKKNRK